MTYKRKDFFLYRLCWGLKKAKGEGSYFRTLDKALEEGKLTREDFFEICRLREKEHSLPNKKFFELFDLIIAQRFQREEEYKKKVSFSSDR